MSDNDIKRAFQMGVDGQETFLDKPIELVLTTQNHLGIVMYALATFLNYVKEEHSEEKVGKLAIKSLQPLVAQLALKAVGLTDVDPNDAVVIAQDLDTMGNA